MFLFATSLLFIPLLPADVPQKVKMIPFLVAFVISVWILRAPLSVYRKWHEADKAEHAKNESLFLNQQNNENQRVSGA
jgi:hypothetical protein